MNLLARREQSFAELQQKLAQKFPDLDRDESFCQPWSACGKKTCNRMSAFLNPISATGCMPAWARSG